MSLFKFYSQSRHEMWYVIIFAGQAAEPIFARLVQAVDIVRACSVTLASSSAAGALSLLELLSGVVVRSTSNDVWNANGKIDA